MKITTSFFVFAILFSLAVPATVASAEELHPGASRDGVGLPVARAAGAETPQHFFLIACWNCQHGQPGAAARVTRCAASENVAKGFGWIGEGVETKSRDATLATHRLGSAAVDGLKVDAQHVDAQARSLGRELKRFGRRLLQPAHR